MAPSPTCSLDVLLLTISSTPQCSVPIAVPAQVPALVNLVVELGVTGIIADYEPHANTTAAHAKAFASFLTTLATALHAKHKQLGAPAPPQRCACD